VSVSRHVKPFLVLALGISVAGCATIRGSQDAIPQLAPATLVPISDALRNYYSESNDAREKMSRRAYREYILSSYLSALESNYKRFTDALQSSDRGSALGLDLVVLGLTGAAALAGASAVDELATITAVASGARATIDKRLFFDRTLPAVVASMDAERARIQAEIARKRTLPAEQYSLDEAVADLHRLQQAGRLDRAVARMTQVAQADRAEQQARLEAIQTACDGITRETAILNQEFRLLLFVDNVPQPARIKAAADALGMELPDGTQPTLGQVMSSFDTRLCDDKKKREFIDSFKAQLNG
jgi:hypothetical protein